MENLRLTCYFNSSIQCLAHSPGLVDYFLRDYKSEINYHNQLGKKGKIALAFGDLLRKLWTPGETMLGEEILRPAFESIAVGFKVGNQEDSQEYLDRSLLPGLREDLSRVKYEHSSEINFRVDQPDDEVADVYWKSELASNDSIIDDFCKGLDSSTLVCPSCQKKSISFTPFNTLSLSLPSEGAQRLAITVMNSDGTSKSSLVTVMVPRSGKLSTRMLSTACSLAVDERLIVAEINNHRIERFLEDPTYPYIDCLIVYRLPKDEKNTLVVFTHQQMEEQASSWKAFGVPLIGSIVGDDIQGSHIRDLYLKLLSPFITPQGDDIHRQGISQTQNSAALGTSTSPDVIMEEANPLNSLSVMEFEFYITDEKHKEEASKLEMIGQLMSISPNKLYVDVRWPEKSSKLLSDAFPTMPPKSLDSDDEKTQEPLSLYRCLEFYLEEELLEWKCSGCKKNRQPTRKYDLWRLPEILVIQLKRFVHTGTVRKKLDEFVDFPDNLDLTPYLANSNYHLSTCYALYAVTNQVGTLDIGHYTALVRHSDGKWYMFDDGRVRTINEKEELKTSAAYILFYRRVADP